MPPIETLADALETDTGGRGQRAQRPDGV